ncbi:hypothetical protein Sgleb_13980 [Streptomyces glebosus]|uniref:Uncharacterized protein n=1 Tax=Streptomyces glebosus TaxID=249580 RepID=A0A640SSV9_9ACTN|nr:hypothetical protein [Streptomyces glebosus]GFE13351.1 hypothetical protein Sgleb_13980 [Streptomyces glebosus]GHG66308.1 hypothetical protein GCM10010513_35340 [Streptomyces glebosus]
MTVKVVEGSGVAACPPRSYALYEGNRFHEADDDARRVLVADEPVPDLAEYGFDGAVRSLVNLSRFAVELYEEPRAQGEHLTFGPTLSPKGLGVNVPRRATVRVGP